MSGKSDDNPHGFVTRAECVQTSSDVKGELKTIRVALVGEDMQGGLVQKVSNLQNQVGDLQKEREKGHSILRAILKDLVAPVIVALIVAAAVIGWHPW